MTIKAKDEYCNKCGWWHPKFVGGDCPEHYKLINADIKIKHEELLAADKKKVEDAATSLVKNFIEKIEQNKILQLDMLSSGFDITRRFSVDCAIACAETHIYSENDSPFPNMDS